MSGVTHTEDLDLTTDLVSVGTALTLQRALPIIDAATQLGIPVVLRGGSGIGKTSLLTHLAAVRRKHLEVILAALSDPTDFGGIPVPDAAGQIQLAPMPWVRHVLAAELDSWVFLDEVDKAPQPTMVAMMRVMLDGVCGDTALPAGTRFVAAMNPATATNGGWELPAPIAGRLLHLDVVADPAEWVTGMLTGWRNTPENLTARNLADVPLAEVQAAQAKVIAFISANPTYLNDEPTDPTLAAGAWPSSRKWDWVSQILPLLADEDVLVRAVEGLVGRAAASAFFTWVKAVDLPDTAAVLADPAIFAWDTEPAERVQAVLTAVVGAGGAVVETYAAAGRVLTAAVAAGRVDVTTSVAKAYLLTAPAGAVKDTALLAALAPVLARAGKVR